MADSTVTDGRLLKLVVSRVGLILIGNLLGLLLSGVAAPGSLNFVVAAFLNLRLFLMVFGPMLLLITVQWWWMQRYRERISTGWIFGTALIVSFLFYSVYLPT